MERCFDCWKEDAGDLFNRQFPGIFDGQLELDFGHRSVCFCLSVCKQSPGENKGHHTDHGGSHPAGDKSYCLLVGCLTSQLHASVSQGRGDKE